MMARALTGGWQVLRSLWKAGKHQKALDLLIRKMLELNPNATEEQLRQGLSFNDDGTLEHWNLEQCNLEALPEEFGMVVTTGDLDLSYNRLTTLPKSFGNVTVGGDLYLSRNQLSSLPESFGNVTVGEYLILRYNQLSEWPKSFPNVKGKMIK